MPRPLMRHGVGQLVEMFAQFKSDQKVLKQLEYELKFRQVPRAVALLADVQAALQGLGSRAAPSAHTTSPSPPSSASTKAVQEKQPELWDRPAMQDIAPIDHAPSPLVEHRPLSPPPQPKPKEAAAAKKMSQQAAPSMPLEVACKILKVTPASMWESIEKARRQIVQQASPIQVAKLSPERRIQVEEEARRANDAFMALLRKRTDSAR